MSEDKNTRDIQDLGGCGCGMNPEKEGFVCPVCGKFTFEKLGDFEICAVCGWENDKVQFLDPDFRGGANSMSLNEAREKYFSCNSQEDGNE